MAETGIFASADGVVLVGFACDRCGGTNVVALQDIRKVDAWLDCDHSDERIMIPAIHCFYEPCDGQYLKCRGSLERLSGPELEAETAALHEKVERGLPLNDSTHEVYGDAGGPLTIYQCERCGALSAFAPGTARPFEHSAAIHRCHRIVCSRCGRVPTAGELSRI